VIAVRRPQHNDLLVCLMSAYVTVTHALREREEGGERGEKTDRQKCAWRVLVVRRLRRRCFWWETKSRKPLSGCFSCWTSPLCRV